MIERGSAVWLLRALRGGGVADSTAAAPRRCHIPSVAREAVRVYEVLRDEYLVPVALGCGARGPRQTPREGPRLFVVDVLLPLLIRRQRMLIVLRKGSAARVLLLSGAVGGLLSLGLG